jgi:excisionase family DNA binding protein
MAEKTIYLARNGRGYEQLVDAREMARRLCVTDKSVLRMAREGRIPSVRFSKRVIRFEPEAVMDAVMGRERRVVGATPEERFRRMARA